MPKLGCRISQATTQNWPKFSANWRENQAKLGGTVIIDFLLLTHFHGLAHFALTAKVKKLINSKTVTIAVTALIVIQILYVNKNNKTKMKESKKRNIYIYIYIEYVPLVSHTC